MTKKNALGFRAFLVGAHTRVPRRGRDPSLAVGEVREAGAATPLRHLLFLKLHARMSVAAARAAAMRLDGLAHAPCMLPPDSRFVADDPDFAWSASLSPLELGPVSRDDMSE